MRVLLVDGTNVVMRYAHAMLPDVVSGKDRGATQAEIEKVLAAVERAIRECAAVAKCAHAIVCTDSNVDSWRKRLYPDYKGSRRTLTGIWSNRLFLYLSPRGWMCVRAPGEEADDVIASLVKRLTLAGVSTAVLSGDSDLLALADYEEPTTFVYQFGRDKEPRYVERSPAYVQAKYGCDPERLHLYKALVGEPGDDLPGVRKIGDKKARKLLDLAMYDDREAGLATLRNLVAAHSATATEEFDLAVQLASLNYDVQLDTFNLSACRVPQPE